MSAAFLMALCLLAGDSAAIDFSQADVGTLPKGWTAAKTGEGPGSVWKIVQDGDERVLGQTSAEGGRRFFNVCVVDEPKLADLDLSVAVKPKTGKLDQGGGLVWRYQDANNYYVCRWNPLEDNFRLYQVVNGKRTQMDHADVKTSTDRYHTIRVTQEGRQIYGYFDGQKLLVAEDNTISSPGQVGLWSKSDAVSNFKNLTVKPLETAKPGSKP